MAKVDVISDLSNKTLCEVPKYILDMTNLKMLYLEGNSIEVIPSELFIALQRLVWLDLRNNKLKTIPQTIANHACLETLLLRDNEIQALPLELGLVPKLKVLQISGNPIVYPKQEVIQDGVRSVVNFLKREYEIANQPLDQNINIKCVISEKTRDFDSKNQEKKTVKPILKLKSFHKDNRYSVNAKHHKIHNSTSKICGNQKEHPPHNSNRYLAMQPVKKNEIRIEEQYFKDVWFKKLKEIMCTQNEVIQKQKDIETLKIWRHGFILKSPSKNHHKDFKKQVPYDIDEEYYKTPSRRDLNNEIACKKVRKSSSKPKVERTTNVDKLIGDIINSLNLMNKGRRTDMSPRSHMEKAGRDIKKIVDLQKRLSMLKLVIANDSL